MYTGNILYWRVVGGYSRRMREYCDSFYLTDFVKDHKHFKKASDFILSLGADVNEYLDSLFNGADTIYHPKPEDLYKPFAGKRWQLYVFNQRIEKHVHQQKVYISKYTAKNPDLTISELMSVDRFPFEAWLRALFLEKPSEKLLNQAMDQLRNPVLLREVQKQGFDCKKLLGEIRNK